MPKIMLKLRRDLLLIFIFYVIGDVVSTYYALPNGYETSIVVITILNTKYSFLLLITFKILFLVYLRYVGEYLINNNYENVWKILANSIVLFGIILTINNTCVIYTGLNLFQHIGII